jgi:hypothetical protein
MLPLACLSRRLPTARYAASVKRRISLRCACNTWLWSLSRAHQTGVRLVRIKRKAHGQLCAARVVRRLS